MSNSDRMKSTTVKVLAAVGLIAVLLLGLWGLIRVASLVPGIGSTLAAVGASLSSIFVPAERLEITIPSANLKSGEPFTLTWDHVNKRTEGSYTLSYGCRDGFHFESITPSGSYQRTACETPFNFTNAKDGIRLIPVSTKTRFVDVPVTLSFTPSGEENPSATTDTAFTVLNEGISTSPSPAPTPTPSPTPRPTPTPQTPGTRTDQTYRFVGGGQASDPFGTPDLAVVITAIGILDRDTNIFTPSVSVRAGARAAVQFYVTNLGTRTADSWSFNASLPTSPFHIFHSDGQRPLGPGDRIEYTIGFDEVSSKATGGVFTLNVDPSNAVRELREDNNITKVRFSIVIP